jgi:Leucine-rich repeat (LRR) protein
MEETKLSGNKIVNKKSKKSDSILARVDECIEQTNSTILDISELEMKEIPPETFRLYSVKTLLAYKNPIQGLQNLCYFENLEAVDISRCSLKSIDDIGLNTSRFLKKLDISRNSLTSIRVLASMPFLEEILASRNKIQELPEELEPLKILKKLDVSYNEIEEPISESLIVKLKELQDLDLTGNRLEPESMGYKTRQMYEKRLLFSNKSMRRSFVTRALGINKEVIAKEQEVMFRSENQEQED